MSARADAAAATHVTRRFRALGFDFAVAVHDPCLAHHLEELFAPLAAPGSSAHLYSLIDQGQPGPRRFLLSFDGQALSSASRPASPVAYLLWHVNSQVIQRTTDLVLVHAAAVERDGQAILLPGPSGAGKTTLAAGLLRAGFRYLTDEAAAVHSGSGRIVPYPKPLAIEGTAQTVLADLAPPHERALEAYLGGRWYLQPAVLRPDAVAGSARARLVIAPRYQAGAPTALSPVSRAQALRCLTGNAFRLSRHGHRGFALLTQVIRGCDCYQLTVGDLDRACELVAAAVDVARARDREPTTRTGAPPR